MEEKGEAMNERADAARKEAARAVVAQLKLAREAFDLAARLEGVERESIPNLGDALDTLEDHDFSHTAALLSFFTTDGIGDSRWTPEDAADTGPDSARGTTGRALSA